MCHHRGALKCRSCGTRRPLYCWPVSVAPTPDTAPQRPQLAPELGPFLWPLSEIDAGGDVAALYFGKGSSMCHQLHECLVLRHCLLHLSISFPTRVARGDEPLSGPRAGVKPG